MFRTTDKLKEKAVGVPVADSAFENDYLETFFATQLHFAYVFAPLAGIWLVCALLLVWATGFSPLKSSLALFSTVMALVVALYFLKRQAEAKRAHKIATQAASLQLDYSPIGPDAWLELVNTISAVPTWNRNKLKIKNFVNGDFEGTPIVLFDSESRTTDSDRYDFSARVAVVPADQDSSPDFTVEPRGVWSRALRCLLATIAPTKPAISVTPVPDTYKLTCKDESLSTRLPIAFIQFLEEYPGWYIEKRGQLLIIACLFPRPLVTQKENISSFQMSGSGLPPLKVFGFVLMGNSDKLHAFIRQIMVIRSLIRSNSV